MGTEVVYRAGKIYGVRWGPYGKVYSVRKYGLEGAAQKAEHQGRAIYASGTRGWYKMTKKMMGQRGRRKRY